MCKTPVRIVLHGSCSRLDPRLRRGRPLKASASPPQLPLCQAGLIGRYARSAVCPGSLAASWTRPGDPRSALDGSQREVSSSRSRRCSHWPCSPVRGRATTRSRPWESRRSSSPPSGWRQPHATTSRSGGSTVPGIVVVAGAVALTAWAGASIGWSIAGDRSWDWLARGLVYLAFLTLGLLGGALAAGARRVAAALAVVVAAALAWSLLGVAVPALFEDGDRIARLREPVGYWNALALLADAGLALGLWLARARRIEPRVWGMLLVYGATIALAPHPVEGRHPRRGRGARALALALGDASGRRRPHARRRASGGRRSEAGPSPVPRSSRTGRSARTASPTVAASLRSCSSEPSSSRSRPGGFHPARLVAEREAAVRRTLLATCALVLVVGLVGLVAAVGNPVSWSSQQLDGEECTNDAGAAHGSLREQPPRVVAGVRSHRRARSRSAARGRGRSS